MIACANEAEVNAVDGDVATVWATIERSNRSITGEIHLAASDFELGDVADEDSVEPIGGEVALECVLSDVADCASVGDVGPALADLGFQAHGAHELVDKFVVDHPALVTQVEQYPPVAVAVFVALKTVPDRLFELGMFIRCGESFWW